MKRKVIVLLLLACVNGSDFSMEQEAVVDPVFVFGLPNADFMAPRRAIASPANRWKPGEEPFPVDVAEFARTARQHLLGRHPSISGTVSCISIEIRPFMMKTLLSKDVPDLSKQETVAWYLVFAFAARLANGKQLDAEECTVGMMLDGTILEMVRRKNPLRQ